MENWVMKLQVSTKNRFLFIAFLVLLSSCSAKHNDSASDRARARDVKIQEKLLTPDAIYYEDIYALVLKDSCLECHSSSDKQGDVDLSNYLSLIHI